MLGIGTAMVYPTLLAAIGDVAHPTWRASSIGVYRFWRDLGYAAGALITGIAADALGMDAAMWLVAALTFGSGVIVAVRMREPRREPGHGLLVLRFESAAERQFTPEKAAKELQSYRRGRLGPTTRVLRDSVVDAGLNQGALLDIGGGVGALAFELLADGMSSALVLDASAAYVAAASEEAQRQGGRARVLQGDFVRMSETVPPADLVSLDRVVCCYPQYEPLLDQALRHAQRGLALSYPRDRWYVRAAVWFDNAKRARRSGFRMFVHPPSRIQRAIERARFVLIRRRVTLMWTMDVYMTRRRSSGT